MARAARQETRQPVRPEIRGRNGEVLTRARTGGAESPFHVPDNLKDKDWDYQWVRSSCYGKEDPANLFTHQENGWRPVPADREGFAGRFGESTNTNAIEREGLILMERPMELSNQARHEDYAAAVTQRKQQVDDFAMNDLPSGFDKGYAQAEKRVKRTIEPGPVSALPKREIAVSDEE